MQYSGATARDGSSAIQEYMPRRLVPGLLGLLLTIIAPLTGVAAEFRILRYEPLFMSEALHPRSVSPTGPATGGSALRFHAFGTDFALDLEPNERINGALSPAQRATTVALRGVVVGRAGSWVRLTRDRGQLSGMLFDGHELYTIEPAADARPFIRNPAASLRDDEQVIYRLTDTLTDMEGKFCGVEMVAGVATQADVYHALAAQMQTYDSALLVATKQLEIGVVADYELTAARANDTEPAVLARMNIVDGIFTSQVGVHLAVRSVTTFPADTDPFTGTDPSTVLGQLATYRRDTPAQQATGLTHLMTGRNLDGDTVGIAYLGGLCTTRNSASLSEANTGVTTSALIAAHEIGHVFGAPHDNETGSACETTAATFLMAPRLNSSSTFSTCSLAQMSPNVATRSCLSTVAQSDAALVVPASAGLALNQTTVVSFSVRSEGPAAIGDVQVNVALPPGITISGAGAESGTCQIGPSQVSCALTSIPAGNSREVQMSLIGLVEGTSIANITLTAPSDAQSANNSAQLSLVTTPGADVSVTVAASSASIDTGATAVATITVSNLSGVSATGTRLTATLPAGLAAVSVATNLLGCTVDGANAFSCTAVSLPANSSQSVALTLRGTSAGTPRLNVAVTSQLGDPNAANNAAGVTITVAAAPAVTVTPPAAGGGGGRLDIELPVLGAALALALLRRRRALDRARG
jgi:uncharacterized repeat protein (TIGR01451 family)